MTEAPFKDMVRERINLISRLGHTSRDRALAQLHTDIDVEIERRLALRTGDHLLPVPADADVLARLIAYLEDAQHETSIEDSTVGIFGDQPLSRELGRLAVTLKAMASPHPKWSEPCFTQQQRAWCIEYERICDFEPMMEDFIAGNMSFAQAARNSINWYESHASDTFLKLTRLPGDLASET